MLTTYPPTVIIGQLHTKLLDLAERLFQAGREDRDQYGLAVIVAATACEVAVDRALAKSFKSKGVPELDDPIGRLIGTNALVREQNRKLYETLTGDQIGQEAFWADYRTLVENRNRIAHKGTRISDTDARKDIENAKLFVEHVVKHNRLE